MKIHLEIETDFENWNKNHQSCTCHQVVYSNGSMLQCVYICEFGSASCLFSCFSFKTTEMWKYFQGV